MRPQCLFINNVVNQIKAMIMQLNQINCQLNELISWQQRYTCCGHFNIIQYYAYYSYKQIICQLASFGFMRRREPRFQQIQLKQMFLQMKANQKVDKEDFLYIYPPDPVQAENHRKATMISKNVAKEQLQPSLMRAQCQCCGRIIGKQPKKQFCYSVQQLSYLGTGIPLYFIFFQYVIFLLVVCLAVFGIYAFISDLAGNACDSGNNQCESESILNRWSILNSLTSIQTVLGQKWVIVGLIVTLLVLMLIIRYILFRARNFLDQCLQSPSDYSIIIRRIPQNASEKDIEAMIKQYNNFLEQKQKMRAMDLEIISIVMSYNMEQYNQIKSENLNNFKKSKLTQDQNRFVKQALPELTKFTSTAIVVFNSPHAKQLFEHKETTFESFIHFFWRQYPPRSDIFQIENQYVAIQRAPQPDDIIWQNCGKPINFLLLRKIFYLILTLIVLGCGGGLQYGLAQWRRSLSFDQDTIVAQIAFSVFAAVIVLVFNFFIQIVLLFAAKRELNDTKTGLQISMTQKIAFFQFLNTGIFVVAVNILAEAPDFDSSRSIIAFDILILMSLNAITYNVTTFALNWFQVLKLYPRYKLKKQTDVYTQIEANDIMEGPPVQLVYKYSYIFKTFWLTAFFFPTVPIVIIISLIGLLINYFIQKLLFSSVYKAPVMISSQLNGQVLTLLDFTLLWITLGSFLIHLFRSNFVYSDVPQSVLIPHWIGFGISIFHIIFPYSAFLGLLFTLCGQKEQQQNSKTYYEVEKGFEIDYKRTNPKYTSQKDLRKKKQIFITKNIVGILEQPGIQQQNALMKLAHLFPMNYSHQNIGITSSRNVLVMQ